MKKLSLSRNMAPARRFAAREFTNRGSFLELGEAEISRLLKSDEYFRVITYYGLGGIGKSSLLKELHSRNESKPLTWIRVDLEFGEIKTPVDVLYEIYRSSGVRYFPFEYALALIWERRGVSIHDIRNRLISLDSAWSAIGDTVASTIPAPASVSIATFLRLSDNLADAVRKRHYLAEIEAVRTATDSEREHLLPLLLAQGIKADKTKKRNRKRLVVSIDSLDSLVRKPGFGNQGDLSQDWLKELVGNAECGLWLMAGREKLRWHEDLPDWNQAMEQHLVGSLSGKDSEKFLRSIEITERHTVDAIVRNSRGVPIALDLAASLYLAKKEKGSEPQPSDFLDTADGLLKKYLSHLDKRHADAIRCLALLDEFDYELAAAALDSWNLHITVTDFRTICNSIMALQLEGGIAEYRIHSLIREPVGRSVTDLQDKSRVLKALVNKADQIQKGSAETGAWAFTRCLEFMRQHRVGAGDAASKLFLVGYRAMEAGGYGSFAPLVRALSHEMREAHDCAQSHVVLDALLAYLERRTGRLREASDLWTSLGSADDLDQDARGIVRYLSAHTEHLLGNYANAVRVYEEVTEQFGKQGGEYYPYAVRQLADIRMLQGEFDNALKLFERSCNLRRDPTWLAEVLRHKGHVFRHNYLFDEAKEKYDAASELAHECGGMMMLSKLKTNYLELAAWQQPEIALTLLQEAIEGNKEFENYIEVGKCLTAGAVASAMSGRGVDAERQAREALEVQKCTGYLSGQLFALCALALTQLIYQSALLARETRDEIMKLEDKIGVYSFYRAVLDYCLDERLKEDVAKLANWLNYLESRGAIDEVSARVRNLSRQFGA